MQTAIHVAQLSKSYGNRLAVDNISLSVECLKRQEALFQAHFWHRKSLP